MNKPSSLEPHFELKSAVDSLYWCLEDRYRADDDNIIKGSNEMVAFYSRPNAEEAKEIADALEHVVAPIRRRQAKELIARIGALLESIREQVD